MKNINNRISAIITLIAAIVFGFIPQNLKAQTGYKLSSDKDVTIKVLGSSNVHDWTMISSSTMESQCNFKFDAANQLRALPSFSFSLNATSLKSEHESMDNRTYKTIKADKFPKITYKLNSAVITQVQKNKYLIKATGDLTIAGTTQTITMDVTAIVNADNTLSCTGSQKLKLTDYKIDPPSFMLGAMKVANDLTIQFNLIYKNNQLITKTN
ncbi:MAG: yceI [Mucilaginibacter sp.]|nr:yceI [Mucilaginibacter sp.]